MNKNNLILWVIFIFCVFFTSAHADSIGGTVTSLQNNFNTAISNWLPPLQSMAKGLLLTLATISYTWSFGLMLLRGADIQDFFTELVRMIMFTGFFYWLILESPTLASAIVNGWIWIAGEAGGASTSPNVGLIIERGFTLGSAIYESSDGIAASIVAGILAVVIMIIYSLIASKALLVMLEMYVVTASGVILLGFGGNDWMVDYAKRYITYTMSVGIKLFVLYLVVATGDNFLSSLTNSISYDSVPDMLALIGIVLLILVLVWQIPDTVQAMLSGASIGSASQTAVGSAKMAAAAVGGAVTGAVGMSMAVKEAAKMAESQPGSSAGFQYKAMNTANNLANAAGAVVGNRMMGDYNASSGSLGGSMAQHLRQQQFGGSGLYGGVGTNDSHVGGTSVPTGNSIGAAGGESSADSSKQNVHDFMVGAGYKSPAVDLTRANEDLQ